MNKSKRVQLVTGIVLFALAAIVIVKRDTINEFFGSSVEASSSQKQNKKDTGKYVYESYSGNTVPTPTWTQAADDMVIVNVDGISPYFIDKYEAVISQRQAWSVAGQIPTTKLTFQDAVKACEASGKRICTTEEWRVACRDGSVTKRYFNNTQEMLRNCDFGRSKGYDKNDHAGKTNSHPQCISDKLGLHHMHGNVSEMTLGPNNNAVIVGNSYLGTKYYGAAFEGNPDEAMRLTCEYTVINNYPKTKQHNEGIGFRCCQDAL